MTVHAYLERIKKYARCSDSCFVVALIYIDRLIETQNVRHSYPFLAPNRDLLIILPILIYIDLLIETHRTLDNRFNEECKLAARLYIILGGRKVDVLLKDELTQVQSIHTQAIKTGIVL